MTEKLSLHLPSLFTAIRRGPRYHDIHSGRDSVVFAVVDRVADGYLLAARLCSANPRFLSQKALAMYTLNPGGPSRGGDSAFRMVHTDQPGRACMFFVYPEHELTPKGQTQFVASLCKRPEIRQFVLITTCPIMITDFTADRVFLVPTGGLTPSPQEHPHDHTY